MSNTIYAETVVTDRYNDTSNVQNTHLNIVAPNTLPYDTAEIKTVFNANNNLLVVKNATLDKDITIEDIRSFFGYINVNVSNDDTSNEENKHNHIANTIELKKGEFLQFNLQYNDVFFSHYADNETRKDTILATYTIDGIKKYIDLGEYNIDSRGKILQLAANSGLVCETSCFQIMDIAQTPLINFYNKPYGRRNNGTEEKKPEKHWDNNPNSGELKEGEENEKQKNDIRKAMETKKPPKKLEFPKDPNHTEQKELEEEARKEWNRLANGGESGEKPQINLLDERESNKILASREGFSKTGKHVAPKQEENHVDTSKMFASLVKNEQGETTMLSNKDSSSGSTIKFRNNTIDLSLPENYKEEEIENVFWEHESRHHFFGNISKEEFISSSKEKLDDLNDKEKETLKKLNYLKKLEEQLEKDKTKNISGNKAKTKEKKSGWTKGHRSSNEKGAESKIENLRAEYNKIPKETRQKAERFLSIENYRKKLKLYRQVFLFCKVIADKIEKNSGLDDDLAYSNAYKMLVIFENKDLESIEETIKKFTAYINKFNMSKVQNVVHDLFAALYLPDNGQSVSLDKWREIINNFGPKAASIFAVADKIEEKKARNKGIKETHIAPETFQEAQEIQTQITYQRSNENTEFAKLCTQYKVPEEIFNRCLGLAKKRKNKDNLPDVKIDGSHVKTKEGDLKGFWLVKLPINDQRAPILGYITNCCQSIGGDSEKCVIDGITRENNGFYVLLKEKDHVGEKNKDPLNSDGKIDYDRYNIVGQGYAWLSKAGNLVFDSWENLTPTRDDTTIQYMLEDFGRKVSEENEKYGISRVTIGKGGKTPKFFINLPETSPDFMKEGHQYGDSYIQSVIYESKKLIEVREKIASSFVNANLKFPKDAIISIKLANNFLSHIENKESGPLIKDFLARLELMNNGNEELARNFVYFISSYDKKDLGNLIENLQKLTDEKIKILFSWAATATYFFGVKITDLKDFDADKIRALTSERALKAYKSRPRYITYDYLKDFGATKIMAFISKLKDLDSKEVIKLYKSKYATPEDLIYFDQCKIYALTSEDALKAYESSYMTFNDLKDFDADKIYTLTSTNALEAYKSKYMTFNDLKDFDVDKIRSLTSKSALEAYKSKYMTFNDLKNFKVNKIEALSSENALETYKSEDSTFEDLKKLKAQEIIAITSKTSALNSDEATESCNSKYTTYKELETFDANKIYTLTSTYALEAYKSNYMTFNDLKNFDTDKIKALTSGIALEAYKSKYMTFNDLKDFDADKIWALTCTSAYSDAVFCYKYKYMTFNDLKDFDTDKIRALTTFRASTIYKNKLLTFNDLKGFEEDKIRALTSKSALETHESGYTTFKDLKVLDADKIYNLTSKSALNGYKDGYMKFNDLKDFDADKIYALTSERALNGYKDGYMTFNDLKGFKANKIEALTSASYSYKMFSYKYRGIAFNDLKDFDTDKIRALTSNNALAAYEDGHVTFDKIKDFDCDKIQLLLSPHVVELFKFIGIQYIDLKDLNIDYLNLLISKSQEQKASIKKYKEEKRKNGENEQISFEELKSIVDLVDIEDHTRCNIM